MCERVRERERGRGREGNMSALAFVCAIISVVSVRERERPPFARFASQRTSLTIQACNSLPVKHFRCEANLKKNAPTKGKKIMKTD